MNEISQLTLAQIVNNDFRASAVFEKYDLDFCCKGKRTLEQACAERHIPVEEITGELEQAFSISEPRPDFTKMNLTGLCEHIVQVHHHFVKKELPQILAYLQKISAQHGEGHPELYKIFDIFTVVKKEMESHMQKEELILFPRIKELQKLVDQEEGNLRININYLQSPIAVMEEEHDHAGNLLHEIRNLSRNYSLPGDACTTYQLCFTALKAFEEDLHRHIHLENNILFPKAIAAFRKLENTVLN